MTEDDYRAAKALQIKRAIDLMETFMTALLNVIAEERDKDAPAG
jgi:hypothetical protein